MRALGARLPLKETRGSDVPARWLLISPVAQMQLGAPFSLVLKCADKPLLYPESHKKRIAQRIPLKALYIQELGVQYYNITVLSHAQKWYVLNTHKKFKHCK